MNRGTVVLSVNGTERTELKWTVVLFGAALFGLGWYVGRKTK